MKRNHVHAYILGMAYGCSTVFESLAAAGVWMLSRVEEAFLGEPNFCWLLLTGA